MTDITESIALSSESHMTAVQSPSSPNISINIIDNKSPTTGMEGLSKNARKRLIRQQRYEETKHERRRAEKERLKRKKEEIRQRIEQGTMEPPLKKQKIEQIPSTMRVVIDCSFNDLMTEKEISSMAMQISRCYSANKSSRHPVQIAITSHETTLKERFDNKHKDAQQWRGVKFLAEPYDKIFEKKECVYLTADAEETLETLDENACYVIGGIVDKNRHKNLCYKKAIQSGVRTAQLPIGNYIKLATRKVLTVNHVFEILLHYLEAHNWEQAFLKVIPQRKFKLSNACYTQDEESDVAEEVAEAKEIGCVTDDPCL